MKLGIIGLPNTGKKSLFTLLTGDNILLQSDQKKSQSGIAEISDTRFNNLVRMYSPKKVTKARINIELFPGLDQVTIKDSELFKKISETDAVCHVVRAFEDNSIYHIEGSVSPERDIDTINSELMLYDMIFIERRQERIEKNKMKAKDDSSRKEEEILSKFKVHLEAGLPLRCLDISAEELKIISGYPFITIKPLIILLNMLDTEIKDTALLDRLNKKYSKQNIYILKISAWLEYEIATFESEDEKIEFMKEYGIEETSLNIMSRAFMESLGLISFFTVGDDEVRQWQVKKGSSAPQAASVIHSDIQRGFIRAEVIKYDDLMALKNEENVKKAGKQYLMGKEYIVEDGDIISFRFNV